ncbi:MAG: ATP-binding cassette domain-containing protein, partial [Proteobacteria bacterium]|nr:ATP-binding cassette domain-containing protein [Pseudomonadota bacterium]
MISLNNITLMRGPLILLKDVSMVLRDGQRTGVIGRNGSGKTSLFRALSGEIPLEQGEIDMPTGLRCASMEQETPGSDRSAVDYVIDAHSQYRKLERSLNQAEQCGDDMQMAKCHSELENIGGYDVSNRAEQLLSGLGFATELFSKPVSSFSGGWRVRLNLAAALMCPSDLLMLDEPTNHLDLEATIWLEQWLQRYRGTLLLVSHDRTFLDSVIEHVISFENRSLTAYKGNYSAFEKQRAEKMALQSAFYEKQQRRRAEIEDFVRRFRAKASKARQAQSRLKELNRMQDIAPAHVDSPFRFQFPLPDQLPPFLLQTESLSIGFDQPLAQNINLNIRSDSRLGLLGFNGSGKSTLLKVFAGKMHQLTGSITKAKKLRIGYFAQHQVDELDMQATPIELLQSIDVQRSRQEIRDFLGGFDFRGTRVDESISNFSGGEKARLALAKIVWQKPNLLLLDEPTNHLDLEMCHALTVALQQYRGAMIMVSHDRYLLANTVDEFYSIHEGIFGEFKGDLHDYEHWLKLSS